MKNTIRNTSKSPQGFTLKEMLVVIAIITIIVAIAVPAVRTSKKDATDTGLDATAKTLNEAVQRAKLKGDTDARINGDQADDKNTAIDYLIANGYVR